jgi:beta-galactosidase
MAKSLTRLFVPAVCLAWAAAANVCLAQAEAPLPAGVTAVWDLSKAFHEKTPTRERICLNGLWRWQPAQPAAEAVPADRWGFFKVPGAWPGITDYMQKDCQTVFAHPAWKDEKLSGVTAAWYQRELVVPKDWASRRILVAADYVNSYAALYIDGKKAGEILFPGGEADVSAACKPGQKHVLSMLVVALPLKGVMLSYSDTNSAKAVKGTVARRGLCGDVYLVSKPHGPQITDVRVETEVRKNEITFDVALEGLAPDAAYWLQAKVLDGGRTVISTAPLNVKAVALTNGRTKLIAAWKAPKIWDLNTPENTYEAGVSLMTAGREPLDEHWPVRFGAREFWIDGRDFYLNGTRLFLSSVPIDNAAVGAAWAGYEAAKESLLRLKSFGINMVYTHNYGCEPGTHLAFEEILRAADDVGMLVSLSQPHFGQYDWKAADADASNGYARHAAFYVRAAAGHPSVVFYSMSHNATGYDQDMNPDMIDGKTDPRDNGSLNNSKLALRAEAIVRKLDPGRIVYHHSSGNLGSMHTSNFYPNFAPVQELSDWLGHWAAAGVKPFFMCEYGAPFTWDWTMYRGWYKGKREWGSAQLPWEFCFAEWSAPFLGDRAFQLGEPEKANLRWEARQFQAGKLWHRWDYPNPVGSDKFDDQHTIISMYITDNWRAYRTWGLSANSPWEFGFYWKLKDGVDKGRKALKVDWENLQRPGFSADYIADRYERMDLAFERTDWVATADGKALIASNGPLLAYIGGKPAAFTSKDHNFLPGETVEKQLILINNSRQTVTCDGGWSLDLPQPIRVSKQVTAKTGEQERIPLSFVLPKDLGAGKYTLSAQIILPGKMRRIEHQDDAFEIDVLPATPPLKVTGKIALFDPKGETAKLLTAAGVPFQKVEAAADLAAYDTLILGKAALTPDGPGPDLSRVRDGLRVIVFEQTSEVLEKRLGFRVEEYGLRQVFARVPDHPALAGLTAETLRDWRGEATILPPRLAAASKPMYGPVIQWCGLDVPRVWRCGCRGNVASVLIEKPARGNFLPLLDGGYSLQYAPLMEFHEGSGLVLFCQMDVTGRTEADPAADRLVRNILNYVAAWKPSPARKAFYAGDAAGKDFLARLGVAAAPYEGDKLVREEVLIVGPGGGAKVAAASQAVRAWLYNGGNLLGVGLDEKDAAALPLKVTLKKAEYINAVFKPAELKSPLAGIGPADVHNRDPRQVPLVSDATWRTVLGDGVLAATQAHGYAAVFDNALLFQLAPWTFDYAKQYDLKRTFRRTSFTLNRLLANLGVAGSTPLLARFSSPVDPKKAEKRWLDGLYLDAPEERDDPYRFFRW